MTDTTLSIAFFDPARGLHGAVRTGVALLFAADQPAALADQPELTRTPEGFRAACGERLSVELEPLAGPAHLPDQRTWLCRVRGTADGAEIDCLGTATETTRAPVWDELDVMRGVTAIFDASHALLCVARRPRGIDAHGDEQIKAVIIGEEGMRDVEDPRLSTVYDGDGRQRSAGLELWLPGEDFPRRAFGTARAGTTLHLEELRVNAAIFDWRMEGREGIGAYDLVVREPAPAAA